MCCWLWFNPTIAVTHSGLLCWDWRHISVSLQRHASAAAFCDNVDHNRHVAVGWYSFVHACTVANVLTDGTCAQANAVQSCWQSLNWNSRIVQAHSCPTLQVPLKSRWRCKNLKWKLVTSWFGLRDMVRSVCFSFLHTNLIWDFLQFPRRFIPSSRLAMGKYDFAILITCNLLHAAHGSADCGWLLAFYCRDVEQLWRRHVLVRRWHVNVVSHNGQGNGNRRWRVTYFWSGPAHPKWLVLRYSAE